MTKTLQTVQSEVTLVAAIIVTYHPTTTELTKLINSIAPQVDEIVLVKNSYTDLTRIENPKKNNITILGNEKNIGLAAAQNIAIRYLQSKNYENFIFFDQDSLPTSSLIRELLDIKKRLLSEGIPIGAVGPLLVDPDAGTEWGFLTAKWIRTKEIKLPNNLGVCSSDVLFSSGSLIDAKHFKSVGLFMESLFIDHVDLEWCYRASKSGLLFFGAPLIRMSHKVGTGHVRFLGRTHAIHSPERDYYAFRNSIILTSLSHIPFRWKTNEFIRIFPRLLFYTLISKNPAKHIKSCLRGLVDGLKYIYFQSRR